MQSLAGGERERRGGRGWVGLVKGESLSWGVWLVKGESLSWGAGLVKGESLRGGVGAGGGESLSWGVGFGGGESLSWGVGVGGGESLNGHSQEERMGRPIFPCRLLTATTWPRPCSSMEGTMAEGGREGGRVSTGCKKRSSASPALTLSEGNSAKEVDLHDLAVHGQRRLQSPTPRA